MIVSGSSGSAPARSRSVARLVQRFPRLGVAVDDYDAAVILEAGGVTDQVARVEYCEPDVFALASRVRSELTRPRVDCVAPRSSKAEGPLWFALPRGFSYLLAGVVTMVAAAAVGTTAAMVAMLSVNVVATGSMHGLSYLGHVAVQRSEPTLARTALRPFLFIGLVVTVAAGALTTALAGWKVGGLVLFPLAYVTSVVVLLVLQRDRAVAAVLIPTGGLALWCLLSGGRVPPPRVALGVAAAAVGVLAGLAWWETRRVRGRRCRLPLGRKDLRAATPLALGGLVVAGFLGANIVAVSGLETMVGRTAGEWLLLATPFFLTLGIAEFAVLSVRDRLRRELSSTLDVAAFRRRARVLTVWMWCGHLAVGAVGILIAVAHVRVPRNELLQYLLAADFFLVGSVLLAALLLMACDAEGILVRVVPIAIAALGAVHLLFPERPPVAAAWAILIVAAVVSVVLWLSGVFANSELRAHR